LKAEEFGNAVGYVNNLVNQSLALYTKQEEPEEDINSYSSVNTENDDVNQIVKNNEDVSITLNDLIEKTEVEKTPVKYFMDNGLQFKLDNGQLFKKVWKTVPITPYMSDTGQQVFPEFRIINKESGKQINSSKYDVQQLVWEPLNLTDTTL
jgi:hypothetical protein